MKLVQDFTNDPQFTLKALKILEALWPKCGGIRSLAVGFLFVPAVIPNAREKAREAAKL